MALRLRHKLNVATAFQINYKLFAQNLTKKSFPSLLNQQTFRNYWDHKPQQNFYLGYIDRWYSLVPLPIDSHHCHRTQDHVFYSRKSSATIAVEWSTIFGSRRCQGFYEFSQYPGPFPASYSFVRWFWPFVKCSMRASPPEWILKSTGRSAPIDSQNSPWLCRPTGGRYLVWILWKRNGKIIFCWSGWIELLRLVANSNNKLITYRLRFGAEHGIQYSPNIRYPRTTCANLDFSSW